MVVRRAGDWIPDRVRDDGWGWGVFQVWDDIIDLRAYEYHVMIKSGKPKSGDYMK